MRQDVFDLINADHQQLARLCDKVLHADGKRRVHAYEQLARAFTTYQYAVDGVLYEALRRAHPSDVDAGRTALQDAGELMLGVGTALDENELDEVLADLRAAIAQHTAWHDEILLPKALRLVPDGHAEASDYRRAKADAARAIDEGDGASQAV